MFLESCHADMLRTCRIHTVRQRVGIEPRTFLLLGTQEAIVMTLKTSNSTHSSRCCGLNGMMKLFLDTDEIKVHLMSH